MGLRDLWLCALVVAVSLESDAFLPAAPLQQRPWTARRWHGSADRVQNSDPGRTGGGGRGQRRQGGSSLNMIMVPDPERDEFTSQFQRLRFTPDGPGDTGKLMSVDEEKRLFEHMVVLQDLDSYRTDYPSADEADIARGLGFDGTPALLSALKAANRARSEVVVGHLALVDRIVRRYAMVARGKGISLDDLRQEGSLGLMRATELFQVGQGARFRTYATYHVRNTLLRFLTEQGHGMKTGSKTMLQDISTMQRHQDELRWSLNRQPTFGEIARAVNAERRQRGTKAKVRASDVQRLLSREVFSDSSDATLDGTSSSSSALDSAFPAMIQQNPMEAVDARFMADLLEQVIDQELSPRQAEIMRMRYGLGEHKRVHVSSLEGQNSTRRRKYWGKGAEVAMTQGEIAAKLGMRQKDVSILEGKAIAHLKAALHRGTKVGEAIRDNASPVLHMESLRSIQPSEIEVDYDTSIGDEVVLSPPSESPLQLKGGKAVKPKQSRGFDKEFDIEFESVVKDRPRRRTSAAKTKNRVLRGNAGLDKEFIASMNREKRKREKKGRTAKPRVPAAAAPAGAQNATELSAAR